MASQLKLGKRSRRITLHTPNSLPGLRTLVPGAYQTAAGLWTVPLSVESYELLREKYGSRLSLDTELDRWLKGVSQNRSYMADLATARDAELEHLPRVAPRLYRAMQHRTYQRVGVRFIADGLTVLLADEPGLGKTLMAMGGILEAQVPGPYLIVAPKTAADTVWRREIIRWLPKSHRPVTFPDYRYQRERMLTRLIPQLDDTSWVIIHPEMALAQAWWLCSECSKKSSIESNQQQKLSCGHTRNRRTKTVIEPSYPLLFDIEWGAIIVDESHESLIRRKGAPTQRRRGLEMLQVRPDGIRLAMSGTPWDSKPHQLWGTLNWLNPTVYSAFHRWAELYWQKGGYTGFEIGEFRKDREQMLWNSLSSVALRRTKTEVAPDLPPKLHVGSLLVPEDSKSPIGVWLPMDGKQERAYRAMEALSVAELDSGRLEAATALAELTRLKQLACAYGELEIRKVRYRDRDTGKLETQLKQIYTPSLPSNKFDWVISSLEEWGYPKNPLTKVVIVSFYTSILRAFADGIEKHFKTKRPLCSAITGRTPIEDRRRIIDEFNSRDARSPQVMLLNVKAGGTAITLDTADRMIFISETRIPDQQTQAEDRIHRISNPRQCMYYYLRSEGTVDIGTALANQELTEETHRLLDGRRGLDYVRHILELSYTR